MARIIIVDDDEIIAEIAIDVLAAAGHIVSAVHDGNEAVASIDHANPDLVILDYNLPGKTGMEILRQVRGLPNAVNMPIVMLTARRGGLLKARAEQSGADDYIVKPFKPDHLVRRVDALLMDSSIARSRGRRPATISCPAGPPG